jgi:hypothetical protein
MARALTVNDPMRDRPFANLRALSADVDRLPEIPEELAEWIAALTPEDLERIRRDVKQREPAGLLPRR